MPIIIIGIVIILIAIFMYLTHPVNYEPSHYEAIGARPTKVIHKHKAQKKLVVKKPTIKKTPLKTKSGVKSTVKKQPVRPTKKVEQKPAKFKILTKNYNKPVKHSTSKVKKVATKSKVAKPAAKKTVKTAVILPTRTSGFNFNNHHFAVRWFSGTGHVAGNQYVYRWTSIPRWYLFERTGIPAGYINKVKVGSKVVVNGKTYQVKSISRHIANNNYAVPYVLKHLPKNGIGWQECETGNNDSTLKMWFAKEV